MERDIFLKTTLKASVYGYIFIFTYLLLFTFMLKLSINKKQTK